MNKYFYDLHIHSCLSPCGDNDMTPMNIAGMASIKGLQIIALTDHNTCDNCPAFFACCKAYGIIPVAGMELTTSEDIHLVCLFPTLEAAMSFNCEVSACRIRIKNKPSVFGEQLIMDENDNIIGNDEDLLINATTLSIDEGAALCRKFGGACHPAHIDRESGGAVAILGTFPDWLSFKSFEISGSGTRDEMCAKFNSLNDLTCVKSSDAHYLGDISEAENYFMLQDEPYSGAAVRENLIKMLSGDGA